jgi:hypothetical protein
MEDFSAVVHRIPRCQPFLDFLFVVMGPPVCDDHESPGEKGVDDGTQKDQRCDQIEWLLTDPVCQDADNAAHIRVAVTFQAGWKNRTGGRWFAGSHYYP